MSCDCLCSVALPQSAVGGLQCVVVLFPGHSHLLFGQTGPELHSKCFKYDYQLEVVPTFLINNFFLSSFSLAAAASSRSKTKYIFSSILATLTTWVKVQNSQ